MSSHARHGLGEAGGTRRKLVVGLWTKAASQSFASASGTAVTFDNEVEDDYNLMVTPGSTVTIPVGLGGRWLILGRVHWVGFTSGRKILYINVNGATVAVNIDGASAQNSEQTQELTLIRTLGAGASVRLDAYQDSGSSRDILGVNSSGLAGATAFQLVRLGDA